MALTELNLLEYTKIHNRDASEMHNNGIELGSSLVTFEKISGQWAKGPLPL